MLKLYMKQVFQEVNNKHTDQTAWGLCLCCSHVTKSRFFFQIKAYIMYCIINDYLNHIRVVFFVCLV